MKNILQKFKEFPLSIKIIVIFCVIAIFDVLEGLHGAINNIYNKDGGTVTTVILFIIAAVFVISFLMQLINIFKKDKKAYTFSKIQSRLALAVCFLFPISMMFFRLGFIIDGPIFLRNFFGFTFSIPLRFLLSFIEINAGFLANIVVMFLLPILILLILEVWKSRQIKKYCTK